MNIIDLNAAFADPFDQDLLQCMDSDFSMRELTFSNGKIELHFETYAYGNSFCALITIEDDKVNVDLGGGQLAIIEIGTKSGETLVEEILSEIISMAGIIEE